MNNGKFSNNAMMVAGLAVFLATAMAFVWLWFGYTRPNQQQYQSTDNLVPVDISGLETKAKPVLDGLKNNSGIPIPAPTGKMGRVDPFASL